MTWEQNHEKSVRAGNARIAVQSGVGHHEVRWRADGESTGFRLGSMEPVGLCFGLVPYHTRQG